MKYRILLLVVAVMTCTAQLNAQNNLKVILTDGTELEGYISSQHIGKDITVITKQATVNIPAEKVKNIIDNDVKYASLPKEWQHWADEHDAVFNKDNERTVTLSDITTNEGTIRKVRILEQGVKIKYLELTPNTYMLKWDTLSVIKRDIRPKQMLSGVNRRYKLKSGAEYEGQYVGEIPGETISLYQDNGIVQVVNLKDIVKDNRMRVNPNQTLVEQSDLLDVIRLKNDKTYKGIVFELNYFGYDDMDSTSLTKQDVATIQRDFLLIQLDENSTVSANLSDIVEYCKEPNPAYKPLTDIILKEGEFMVERYPAKLQLAKEKDHSIVISADSVAVNVLLDGKKVPVSIESNFRKPTDVYQFKLIKANQFYDKKSKSHYYGFSYENLAKDAVLPLNIVTSVNGTTRIDFDITSAGLFVFYNPLTQQAITFTVSSN